MARHFDDLGPDFDQRWKRTTRTRKRELIGELRDLYILLEEEDDMPLLPAMPPAAATVATPPAETIAPPEAKNRKPEKPSPQGNLFTDAEAGTPPKKENPFLPRGVLARLHESQHQATAGLRDLMQKGQELTEKRLTQATSGLRDLIQGQPLTHEQVDLERELRLKLGPIVENLIEAQLDSLKSELRVRLRAEMDRLIAEHVRK